MATVMASDTMSRAGMKNRLGSRRSERRRRLARRIFDLAGTAMADDLPSEDVVMRNPAPTGRAHAPSATAWLHRPQIPASRRPHAHRTGRPHDHKPTRFPEVPRRTPTLLI